MFLFQLVRFPSICGLLSKFRFEGSLSVFSSRMSSISGRIIRLSFSKCSMISGRGSNGTVCFLRPVLFLETSRRGIWVGAHSRKRRNLWSRWLTKGLQINQNWVSTAESKIIIQIDWAEPRTTPSWLALEANRPMPTSWSQEIHSKNHSLFETYEICSLQL